MGLFDGVGGASSGVMPLGTMTPMSVATSLGAAASAVGLPGFSMVPAPFYLMAGMGWSSRSSYFGHPEFRGVADMAIGSNDLQRGGSPSFMGGLGAFGIGAPPVGSGGYYIGPYPSFNPMSMFGWMYQQTFGEPQQAAGPAQAAAPQPAQVNAKDGEKSADESGDAAKSAKPARRRGGGGARPRALSAGETARLQELERKKQNPIPFWGGLNATEQSEYDALMRRARPAGVRAAAPAAAGGAAGSGGPVAEQPISAADQQRLIEITSKTTPRTDEEKAFVAKLQRDHPSFFRRR